jgi:predicted component of type VI protein secretion system
MFNSVRLTVLTGPHKNRRFCFCGPTRCQVGRGLDCFIQLSGTERDKLISRRHCRLAIDPPVIHVEDLGSNNGTYVNGKKVDACQKEALGETAGLAVSHGDVLTIGGTTLRVEVVACPHAASELAGTSIWRAGETAKKDCPLPC